MSESLELKLGHWYAIKRTSYAGAIAQCLGSNNNNVIMSFYDGWIWRTNKPVPKANILEEVPDPRIIIRIGKVFATHFLDIKYD